MCVGINSREFATSINVGKVCPNGIFATRVCQTTRLPPPSSPLLPVHVLFESVRHGEQRGILKMPPGQHQPYWQAM
jgi:hypothetical protein